MAEQLTVEITMTEVCHSVSVSTETIIEIVEEGIVDPTGESPTEWLFDSKMVTTVRRACRLQRDLELNWAGVGMAMQLIDELELLRVENKMLKQKLARFLEQ